MFEFFANIFGYILNFLYELVKNYGLALIIFSILLKLAMLPLSIKQQKTMKKSTKIQEEVSKLQDKYKNNPEKLNQEIMDLYKCHFTNSFITFNILFSKKSTYSHEESRACFN